MRRRLVAICCQLRRMNLLAQCSRRASVPEWRELSQNSECATANWSARLRGPLSVESTRPLALIAYVFRREQAPQRRFTFKLAKAAFVFECS